MVQWPINIIIFVNISDLFLRVTCILPMECIQIKKNLRVKIFEQQSHQVIREIHTYPLKITMYVVFNVGINKKH